MDDTRLDWIRSVVCRFLGISDLEVFDELFETDIWFSRALYALFMGSKVHPCMFFHYTIEQVEIEVEVDIPDEPEVEKADDVDKSELQTTEDSDVSEEQQQESADEIADESEKSEAESMKEEKIDDTELSETYEEEAEDQIPKDTDVEPTKRYVTQTVEKIRLHVGYNIVKQVANRKYVYLMSRKFEALQIFDTPKEANTAMIEAFEVGLINRHPLVNFLDLLTLVYYPLLEKQDSTTLFPGDVQQNFKENALGELKETCREILDSIEEFCTHADLIVEQLLKQCPFELLQISSRCELETQVKNASFIQVVEQRVQQWTATLVSQFNKIMDKKPTERNPFKEMTFWEERRTEIIALTDHLSDHSMKTSLQALRSANCGNLVEFDKQYESIKLQLNITQDNLNYLTNLEAYLKDLHPSAHIKLAIPTIPDMMKIYRYLWSLSDYYGRAENMGRLIEGLGHVVQTKIVAFCDTKQLFLKDIEEVLVTMEQCSSLARIWKLSYMEQQKTIESFEGLQHWYYSQRILFEKTDYMSDICLDLATISHKLKLMKNVLIPELQLLIEDPNEYPALSNSLTDLALRIRYVDFDIFNSKTSLLWQNLMKWFDKQFELIEHTFKGLVTKIVQSQPEIASIIFLRRYESVELLPSVKMLLNEKFEQLLSNLTKLIGDVEREFLAQKGESRDLPNLPHLSSVVVSARFYLSRMKHPLIALRKDKGFLLTKSGRAFQEQYLKVARMLRKGEAEAFQSWVKFESVSISDSLHCHLLKRGPVNAFFYGIDNEEDMKAKLRGTKLQNMNYVTNFPLDLDYVMMNACVLNYYGFNLPITILNFITQEETYANLVKDLSIAMFKFHSILGSLSHAEAKLLEPQLEALYREIEPGVHRLTWSSLGITQFITKIKQATDYFGSIVTQVHQIGQVIISKIESLKLAKLLHFKKHHEVSTCEAFFGDAERQMALEVIHYVNIYRSIIPLLNKIESLACHTSTGKTRAMQDYYKNCEVKILNALIEMIVENLDLLSSSLDSLIFPYFYSVLSSKDELVLATTENAALTFKKFSTNVLKSTCAFKRWREGTCIEVKSEKETISLGETFEFTFYLDILLHPRVRKFFLSINRKVRNFIHKTTKPL